MRNFVTLLCAAVVAFGFLFVSDTYILKRFNQNHKVTVIKDVSGPAPAVMSQETALHLIQSTLKVISSHGSGTGFIIYAGQRSGKSDDKAYYNYVVTCHHVTEGDSSVTVQQFHYLDGKFINSSTLVKGDVVLTDSAHDLSLIEVKTEEPFHNMVKLLTPPELKKMRLYEPVYTCGCGLGNPPYVANAGNVSLFDDNFIQVTSPVIFGNSGGGVYTTDGRLIGVSRAIPLDTYGGVYPQAGLCVPVWIVDIWLRLNNFGFLNDANDGSSLDKVFESREKAKIEAENKLREQAFQKMIDDMMKHLEEITPPPGPSPDDWGNDQEHKDHNDAPSPPWKKHTFR